METLNIIEKINFQAAILRGYRGKIRQVNCVCTPLKISTKILAVNIYLPASRISFKQLITFGDSFVYPNT
jgi:hypothetical protein